jgi:hypothetical protein
MTTRIHTIKDAGPAPEPPVAAAGCLIALLALPSRTTAAEDDDHAGTEPR